MTTEIREPKERLRQILCTDEDLDSAIKILERLHGLKKEGKANWHNKQKIGIKSEYEKTLLSKLVNGGLLDWGLFGNGDYHYAMTAQGEEIYGRLT